MCKRIWDQEADPVTQSHPKVSPRVKSGKAVGTWSQTLAQVMQQCRWLISSLPPTLSRS